MGCFPRRFTAIAFCLALIILRSVQELIVLRHPPTNNSSSQRKLTCVTDDDDDSALIWNYEPSSFALGSERNSFTDFKPRKQSSRNNENCAIWNSTGCFARWNYRSRWARVNSSLIPMGPVFDYRWEGFVEFAFVNSGHKREYQHVGKVQDTSKAVVFSVRAPQDINVLLCQNASLTSGPCYWILLGGWDNVRSAIRFCPSGVSASAGSQCSSIASIQHKVGDVVHEYEWRTFTIKWINNGKTIQVLREPDSQDEPFLKGSNRGWNSGFDIWITSGVEARFRFHFYTYWLTKTENSLIQTEAFRQQNKYFCIELLVGLCPGCKLSVNLVDGNGTIINVSSHVGMRNSTHNGLLTWQSVKLQNKLENFNPENVKLQIETNSHEFRGKGHWAFDNVRTCKLPDDPRQSTITISREMKTPSLWPRVQCQKLFPGKNSVVDASSTATMNPDIHEIKQLILKWRTSCTSVCTDFGNNWSVCDSTGCDCNQGFWGIDCQKECKYCENNTCEMETGYCSAGCKDNKLQPPLCVTTIPAPVGPDIRGLRTGTVSDTKVKLQWDRFPSDGGVTTDYRISIKLDKLIGCAMLGRRTPPRQDILRTVQLSDGMVSIEGLHPYAHYTATMIGHTDITGNPNTLTQVFQTLASHRPTSNVSNLSIDAKNTLKWDAPVDCTTITGPREATKLVFDVASSGWEANNIATERTSLQYYELSRLKLPHYTLCRVRVYVLRALDQAENPKSYAEITWRTPPGAPPAVEKLEIYEPDPDTNSISLRWLPPDPTNGEIELYEVSILRENKVFRKEIVTVPFLRQIAFPTDAAAHKTSVQVCAKNKNVQQLGDSRIVRVKFDSHFKVPSRPLNLTATPKAHGIVALEWEHPAFYYKKIMRFLINVVLEQTRLQENITREFPKTIEYPVPKTKSNYTAQLRLLTATSYNIFVRAVNADNISSSPAEVNVTVNEGVAFGSISELQISQNGTVINLGIPEVVNATRETMVTVIIDGSCSDRHTRAPVPLSKLKKNWIVAKYRPEKGSSKMLLIPVEKIHGGFPECSSNLGETYKIQVILNDSQTEISASPILLSITSTDHNQGNLVWLIIFPMMAICLLLILFIWHRKRRVVPEEVTYAEILPVSARGKSRENLTGSCNHQNSAPASDNMTEGSASTPLYAVPFVAESNSVSITCFEEYAKKSTFNGDLASQYATFPRGLTKSFEYGRLPENMPKNRNKNLIAYDDTRVVLDKIPGDPHSDYINANYIQGYGEETAYIAAQGPKPNTVNDFWRMIWQKNVPVICMLTNVMENGKKVCEKYWPEAGTRAKYGKIIVFNTDHEVFADYTFRTFQLSLEQESRKVTHLHYTAWSNHGIPMYSQFLVTYLKKLVETLDGRGPVVVHCSEGNGRTGTIILCDMCVRYGIVEREINVPAVTQRMYNSRANMLDSPQQYLLAHVIITESIMPIPTQVRCDDSLPIRMKTMKNRLPSHIQRLNNAEWQTRALHSITQPRCHISMDNKLPELIPVRPEVQVHYQRYSDSNCQSNYIKTVSVDGALVKKRYLASHYPSPSGLPDFWRFIAEKKIELVIILQHPDPNDPTFCDIMPRESILVPVPYIQIQTKTSLNEQELYTIEELVLTDTSEEKARSQSVTVLTCSGWGFGKRGKPPGVDVLVSLWKASDKISRNEGPALVLCQDGITGCGLYSAMSFLLDRMTVEKECDVIYAVRAVRRSRPEFVQSLEQFQYLYEAAVNYAECFQTYANLV